MNVLLVSECTKNALTESRRLLDQFAERRGERTWQTSITQQGLDTLRRLLRKTARKNTAVACHWIRGQDHSELLWIVGDASRFNAQGAVPTNSTARDVLRRADENDWHTGEDIRLLTALAALLHDLGKATEAFQDRLRAHAPLERNQYRHEWASLRLFQSFVGDNNDEQWLRRLAEPCAEDDQSWRARLQRDGLDPSTDSPLAKLPPVARAIGWLVLTHHRLPVKPEQDDHGIWRPLGSRLKSFRSSQISRLLESITANWNEIPGSDDPQAISPYWLFPHGLPVTTPQWRKRAARLALKLLDRLPNQAEHDWFGDPYVMHLSRMSLMLADHYYSSLTAAADRVSAETAYPLHANTCRDTGALNQSLDEHLLGVERHASLIAHALPELKRNLPHLARHKGLRQRSGNTSFRWQDKAADLAASIRERAAGQGFFGVNLASTGCGKTLGNARIMNALADPQQGLRCAIALGLRTLTLQTGEALRQRLMLGDDEIAIRVGGSASRELFDHYNRLAARTGSESSQALLDDDADDGGQGGVFFEGNTDHAILARLTRDARVRALLAAPMLVCTVDHLAPATESTRGGHQIVPMLRLMSSDLVLDELDDFDIDDLPALTRLVYWAGLLGSRVLLSSATLPPAIVLGMYGAYRAGREHFQRNRGAHPGAPAEVCCAWFDEFDAHAQVCPNTDTFEAAHLRYAQLRQAKLSAVAPRRLAQVVDIPQPALNTGKVYIRAAFAALLREQALALHAQHFNLDPRSHKRVSFGLIRMANIQPLVDVALNLYAKGAPEGVRIHLCVYHAQYPLLLRSAIEAQLDAALNRKHADAVFSLPDIRRRIDAHPEQDHLFIVLGSPVIEVGRDHDFDWAVVEPSSMRSLIQLAGRVRRHRPEPYAIPNIALLDTNLKHLLHPGQPAFCKPGFEQAARTGKKSYHLNAHSLTTLLKANERRTLDARPRLLPRPEVEWQPNASLVDLEHARLQDQMIPPPPPQPLTARELRAGKSQDTDYNASTIYTHPHLHLTGVLTQLQPFREESTPDVELMLRPDEAGEHAEFYRVREGKGLVGVGRAEEVWVCAPVKIIDRTKVQGPGICAWNDCDYLDALRELAEAKGLSLETCARRYGTLTAPKKDQGWLFHAALGVMCEE